jgi:hypothetical protein
LSAKNLPFAPVSNMPLVAGTRVPGDLYWVLSEPAPLAGMRYPGSATPWEGIYEAGFRHVVCLAGENPTYDPKPLNLAFAAGLEDLVSGCPPANPVVEQDQVQAAVDAVLRPVRRGEGVVVHCVGGRGRTGTVLGCALRALGYEATEAIEFLDRVHKARGKSGWPEAKWQADLVRRFASKGVFGG